MQGIRRHKGGLSIRVQNRRICGGDPGIYTASRGNAHGIALGHAWVTVGSLLGPPRTTSSLGRCPIARDMTADAIILAFGRAVVTTSALAR